MFAVKQVLASLAAVAIAAAIVLTGAARPFVVPTGSMEPTLLVGDHLLVKRASAPEPGEIVAVRSPADARQIFLKRVIGVGGDHIRVEGTQVWRNNRPLEEPYARYTPDAGRNERDQLEVTVPADSCFVMGDNRSQSLDSRDWGPVPAASVVGRAMFVYWSYDTRGRSLVESAPSGLEDLLRHTRWGRTLHWVRS